MKAIALALALCIAAPAIAQDAPVVRDALAVQKARNAAVALKKTKRYYEPGRFDLADLPAYVPQTKVAGPIRIWAADKWGNPGFQEALAAAFRRFHPEARLEFTGISPGGAFAGLLTGLSDIAVARRMAWADLLSFQRRFDRDPLVIAGMTGWEVNPPYVIAVHKDNPVVSLSMRQLDGIFGAERSGGWSGTSWDPSRARGPEGNLRSWGQLGLSGEWAARQIDPYGYNLQYLFAPRFSTDVMQGGGQWNERLKQFTIAATADGKLISVDQQMAEAVGRNRYAIAYYAPFRGIDANTRAVPIRRTDGRVVTAAIDAVRDHSYPLFDNMFFSGRKRKARAERARIPALHPEP
jgi:phosphate transport system substrate-binding protein